MNRLNALVLLLDFFPGYKRMAGGGLYVLAAAATAYNSFGAPAFGTPVIPPEFIGMAKDASLTILVLGTATAAARA